MQVNYAAKGKSKAEIESKDEFRKKMKTLRVAKRITLRRIKARMAENKYLTTIWQLSAIENGHSFADELIQKHILQAIEECENE